METYKKLLQVLKSLVKTKALKFFLVKVSSKLAGPLGWLAGFFFDYVWKYIEKGAIWLFKKVRVTGKKIDRKIDKRKVKKAKNAKDLKSAVDDYLN